MQGYSQRLSLASALSQTLFSTGWWGAGRRWAGGRLPGSCWWKGRGARLVLRASTIYLPALEIFRAAWAQRAPDSTRHT